MAILAAIFVAIVAIEHLYILVLEMFLWTSARGRKAFGTTEQFAEASKGLAANQGLYNGFLAAGLAWGLFYPSASVGYHIQLFFLVCVVIAAVYGGFTAKRSILVVQGAPALITLVLVLIAQSI